MPQDSPFGAVGREHATGGEAVPACTYTSLWKAYRAYLLLERQCEPSTVSAYREVLQAWVQHLADRGKLWDQATAKDLQRFLDVPCRSGRRRGQPLSTNARRFYVRAIKGLYWYAAAARILPRDPMVLVRAPKRRETAPRGFLLSQLREILLAARDDDRLYVLAWLGFGEGLRIGEMAGLDLADFERDPRPGRLRVLGKGRRERWLPLSPEVRAALDRHLGDRARLTVGPLVENRRWPARPLQPATIGMLLSAHIRACGLEGSAHWLRHSFVYLALDAEQGDNLEHVREAAGHASSATTRLYGKRFAWPVRRRVIDVLPNPELSDLPQPTRKGQS